MIQGKTIGKVQKNHHERKQCDFGRGFYVTTDVNQANTWAKRLGNKNNASGDVVVFEIPESDFNKLNNKTFDSPDAEWGKTVVDGRNGVQPPYDTVSGPMLINVKPATKQGATPKGRGQQTTFLSDKSIDLLNNGMKGKSK